MAEDERRIVALNVGSSSLKFAAYPAVSGAGPILSGSVEGIGGKAQIKLKGEKDRPVDAPDLKAAMDAVAALPEGPLSGNLLGVGHRIVHGGPDFDHAVLVDEKTLKRIEALSPLAPLHNPPALAVLKSLQSRFPTVPHVACFDTAFHRGHPAVADRFAIPDSLYQEGVRRYGFHGLSYDYIASVLPREAPAIARKRVVVAHLGSGASMCALLEGRSVDSSMSFTALDGLPMGTRPGSLDAGVILWLQQQKGWSVDRVETFLYHDCGLKGMSGVSNDIRVLLDSDASLARIAVDYFVYHIARTAAALAVSMDGIDGLVFTGGIGEHSAPVRARVMQRLAWLVCTIDLAANEAGKGRVTAPESRIGAYVIPTDEERVIAEQTLGVLAGG